MALLHVLQVCIYIHAVQTRATFHPPKVNGQNLINRIELMLEMLLVVQFLTTFQVAAVIWGLHWSITEMIIPEPQHLGLIWILIFLAAKSLITS